MLKLSLFGRPIVTLDDEPVDGFISDKALGLLCYLALEQGAHSREKLANLFWGDFPAQRARANLRQALSNLQKLLPGYFDVSRKTAAFLRDLPHRVDVTEFEVFVEHLDPSRLGSVENKGDLVSRTILDAESAAALYQRDFLADLFVDRAPEFESWLGVERERLRLLLLRTLEILGAHYQQQRAFEAAIKTLGRMLTIEPWHEATHRDLMWLYARKGEFESALTQFDRCRKVLVEELEVEPLPETFSLYERIRAARKITRKPMPAQPTPFVGRLEELVAVQELLLREDVQLVTISGLGGVGKTRLALAAAEDLEPAFLEGIAYVSLTAVTEAAGLYSAVAQALGIRLQGKEEPPQQILSYLREKEMLLVLDNFEQVIQEARALESILKSAPNVKILVTSRRRLDLRREHPLFLAGLPVPAAETIFKSSAGQLFMNTAQRAKPGFIAAEADRDDIRQICQMLEGLPLGIELAAAWLRMMSCAGIATQMRQDHSFFAAAQFRDSDRHTSLWATFSYSWQMLSQQERDVFMRLSVFRGGFNLVSARAVAETSLPTLSALVDMSLLRASGIDRYQIHEQLRQFAAEKLNESEAVRFRTIKNHSSNYLEWLAGIESNLKQAGLEETADAVQTDWDNIRHAWRSAVAQNDSILIEQSVAAIYEFCNLRQTYREGMELFQLAAESVRQRPGQEILVARLQLALGALYFHLGMIEDSLKSFGESEPVIRQANLEHELALILMWTGFSIGNAGFAGRISEGADLLNQSLAIFESVGDVYYQARCLGNLGNNLVSQGDYKPACQYFQRSLELFESLDIAWGQAGTLVMLGKYQPLVDQGRTDPRQLLEKGLEIAERIEHKQIIIVALGGLAIAAETEGDFLTAQSYYQQALDYAQALGHSTIADQLNHLGRVTFRLGQTKRSRGYLHRSLDLIAQYGYRAVLGSVKTTLGMLEREDRNFAAAARHFKEAIQVDHELEKIGSVLQTLCEVAELERIKGGEHRLLPPLLAYIIGNRLTTPENRQKMLAIVETLKLDLSSQGLDESAALSLSEVVELVQDEMLV